MFYVSEAWAFAGFVPANVQFICWERERDIHCCVFYWFYCCLAESMGMVNTHISPPVSHTQTCRQTVQHFSYGGSLRRCSNNMSLIAHWWSTANLSAWHAISKCHYLSICSSACADELCMILQSIVLNLENETKYTKLNFSRMCFFWRYFKPSFCSKLIL